MPANQSWGNLVQKEATSWSIPRVLLPKTFEKMSLRIPICHWSIMIAGTFKSCKVFEIPLQFSECHETCCFCRILWEKDLKFMFGKSQNVTAGSCNQIHSSDVRSTVSDLCGKKAIGQNSDVGSLQCQGHCVEFRPYAGQRAIFKNRFHKRHLNRGKDKLKRKLRTATEMLNANWEI